MRDARVVYRVGRLPGRRRRRSATLFIRQVGEVAGVFEGGEAVGGEVVELGKKGFVEDLEVEAGLALHAGFQLCRATVEQLGAPVNRHEMITYVILADLESGNGHGRFMG